VIAVPTMGDSISEGVIEEFVKNAGDFVEADEVIARIETDKVTVDITAPAAGVIQKYFNGVGDTVSVGADFYSLDTDAKGSSTPAAPKAATPEAPTPVAEAPKQVS
jgi:2-oxoglutarate dehydrogenase E2 component (dihydrolipoamide succinyltransferase)